MGKRGPPPTPDAVLKLRGSNRVGRHCEAADAPTGIPDCPDCLVGPAREVWGQFADIADNMKVLTVADGPALAVLCEVWAQWRQTTDTAASEGHTFVASSAGGETIRRHPASVASADFARLLNRMLGEFGMTPSARTRVQASTDSAKEGNDKKRAILNVG